MKTREEIITGMCYTFRHDYGLDKSEYTGMSKEEREQLYKTMAQIFDNDIKPYMVFREWDEYSGMPAVKDYVEGDVYSWRPSVKDYVPHNLPIHVYERTS